MWRRLCTVGLVVAALAVVPALTAQAAPVVRQTGENWQCVEVSGDLDLNIRSGPGLTFGVIGLRAPGTQMDADFSREQSDSGYTWVPVRFDGTEGWTISARLTPCPSAAPPAANQNGGVAEGVNQDGTLDRFEIAEVARSVVLIANVQDNEIVATGTGTITTPDGLIVTNAHVVQDADLVAVGLLDNINDPPEFRYIGEVVTISDEIDVALIAIRYDSDGNLISGETLHLPYIPASLHADEVFRGDPVYIFGYPGIGDDYLVVTTGSIVSVENGEVNGQRLPVWYRTDAEIAPGNSGGLVVNGDGQFVGIPTFVRAESETGGRLGGIRPAEVAMLAVTGGGITEGMAADSEPPSNSDAANVKVQFGSVTLDHGVMVDGQPGLQLSVTFGLDGWQNQDATLYARFYYDDLVSPPLINPDAPGKYRDKDNQVLTSAPVIPCCDKTDFDGLVLFIPYDALGLVQPGTYPLKIRLELASDDQSWHRTLSWEFIVYSQG